MQQYLPLFALALVATIFAAVQDLKYREVANWLNFALIASALAYRAFYASATNNLNFFLFGFFGFLIMFALGNAFYYMKTFAGGDAKLLMGFGIILPYQSYVHLIILPLLLIFVLFFSGAVYSLIYSAFIVMKNKKEFSGEFKKMSQKRKPLLVISTAVFFISLAIGFYQNIIFFVTIISLLPLTFIYTKSLEKCMIVLLPPKKLTEGDWLENDVRINSKITIKKTVHGLTLKDIQILKKYKRSVLIKQGIPFVPAFLITLIIMALAFLTLKFPFSLFLS